MPLPHYESTATPEEKAKSLEWYGEQYRLIMDQHKNGTPALFVKIRCGCNKLIALTEMYRCLYCGVWFCKACAEIHFGKQVPESFVDIKEKQP